MLLFRLLITITKVIHIVEVSKRKMLMFVKKLKLFFPRNVLIVSNSRGVY